MKSDIKVDDTRAAEVGVFVHEGREYAAGGFSIDVKRGRMLAYVTRRPDGQYLDGPVPPYYLSTWGGCWLADLERTDAWVCVRNGVEYPTKGWGPMGFGTKLQAFRTLTPIAGFYWYGRGLGAGMYLKLRRGRKVAAK